MLVKFRIPEIVLGMLFATSLVLLGFVFASSQPSQSPLQHESTTENSGANGKGEVSESFWQRTLTDPVAFFTLWIAAFTAVLGFSTIGLLRATSRSANISERALTVLERPYVFFLDVDRIGKFAYQIAYRNYGKAPAIVASVRYGVQRAPHPPNPKEGGKLQVLPSGAVIGPGEPWTRGQINMMAGMVLPLPEGDWFLHGHIIYRDLFGNEWQTWFCRRFNGNQFILGDITSKQLNGNT